ncbi:O-antigen ligase family protein [Pseudomonas sp. RTB3]|uniref:O-antigen ligase family protein n=2 Tax=Pseudomonas TaxID=286 RepID=UPI00387E5033
MNFTSPSIPRVFLPLCLLLMFTTAVVSPLSGHNWQRIAQMVIGFLSLAVLLWAAKQRFPLAFIEASSRFVCLLILVLGLTSTFLAHQPLWAFTELSLLITSCCIALAFASERKFRARTFDQLFICFVIILCAIKCVQFFSSIAAAFVSAPSALDTDLLLDGFSNRRFYGQFQTFTLPLLAFPALLPSAKRSTKVWIAVLLSIWWMIAITGGTRGTWLGMGVAALALLLTGYAGRRWLVLQFSTACAGLVLFWFFLSLLPGYLGIEVVNFAGDRLNTSLSAREIIWSLAWEMIKQRPLLGFGPMHFADIQNSVGAHPHQAILQWASEWGVPSTLCVGFLVLRGLVATFISLRKSASSVESVDVIRLCLFASLVGALTQSMVDGVIVMPYSQLWLAIIVGWLLALHKWDVRPSPMGAEAYKAWMSISVLAVALLMYIAIRDLPHMSERSQHYAEEFGSYFHPRFWTQGIIALKAQ